MCQNHAGAQKHVGAPGGCTPLGAYEWTHEHMGAYKHTGGVQHGGVYKHMPTTKK